MTLDHHLGDVDQLPAAVLRMVAKQLEGSLGVDRVMTHQDPLGLLDLRAPPESSLEILILGETLERDVDRALQLIGTAVDDVRKHASLGSLMDIRRVVRMQERNHRTRGLSNDLPDQLES